MHELSHNCLASRNHAELIKLLLFLFWNLMAISHSCWSSLIANFFGLSPSFDFPSLCRIYVAHIFTENSSFKRDLHMLEIQIFKVPLMWRIISTSMRCQDWAFILQYWWLRRLTLLSDVGLLGGCRDVHDAGLSQLREKVVRAGLGHWRSLLVKWSFIWEFIRGLGSFRGLRLLWRGWFFVSLLLFSRSDIT